MISQLTMFVYAWSFSVVVVATIASAIMFYTYVILSKALLSIDFCHMAQVMWLFGKCTDVWFVVVGRTNIGFGWFVTEWILCDFIKSTDTWMFSCREENTWLFVICSSLLLVSMMCSLFISSAFIPLALSATYWLVICDINSKLVSRDVIETQHLCQKLYFGWYKLNTTKK